ncbi:hypothetical protein [Fischerella muscicola]|nr:hypothetical protein [Fischerella muscicola]
MHAHSIGDRPVLRSQNSSLTSPGLIVSFSTQFSLLYRIYCAVSQIIY